MLGVNSSFCPFDECALFPRAVNDKVILTYDLCQAQNVRLTYGLPAPFSDADVLSLSGVQESHFSPPLALRARPRGSGFVSVTGLQPRVAPKRSALVGRGDSTYLDRVCRRLGVDSAPGSSSLCRSLRRGRVAGDAFSFAR